MMRPFTHIEQRWSQLFSTSIGVDLRQAVRDDATFDPCENGLRSVCWKSFLLYGPLSRGSWSKKLAESRSAYTSLRDHFLKYINNPNDLHSSSDPLADDGDSPWSSLRQDELNREEIFQDVTRCMQDNYFFKEPVTQKKLLDILFIYSKLNPDTGYRQGMHELLAPILWVIEQDAVDGALVTESEKSKEGIEFMLEVLDKKFVEHDAFSLFCAVMQTAKSFYEIGETKDSATIVAQSNRIHDELLTAVDSDLAQHLQVIGVLPQIYSIRWIRLLFGREFEFKDVLKLWDLLFAEGLTLNIIDMTCVAMLLRVHWQLIEADYTNAITSLTRFYLPTTNESPRSLVKDAVFLKRNLTSIGGADIIERYSGQRPNISGAVDKKAQDPSSPTSQRLTPSRRAGPTQSPTRSPARFSTPQKQIENLFQGVSGNLQRRTEGWSKTVRGAVGEVRKNMNNLQAIHSRAMSTDEQSNNPESTIQILGDRLRAMETRNKALAKMLDGALGSLRTCKPSVVTETTIIEDTFNLALARVQFVSVYLADPDITIPSDTDAQTTTVTEAAESIASLEDPIENKLSQAAQSKSQPPLNYSDGNSKDAGSLTQERVKNNEGMSQITSLGSQRKGHSRPSLNDSSFLFMLGENRKRSSFVSSISDLPEQRRGSDASSKADQSKTEGRDQRSIVKKEDKAEEDGFTLNSLG